MNQHLREPMTYKKLVTQLRISSFINWRISELHGGKDSIDEDYNNLIPKVRL